MARDDRRSFPPPNLPKLAPPAHGVRVQEVGVTWWGEHWVAALSRFGRGYAGRLARGRNYAQGGRVHDLTVRDGVVTASVTGTDRYTVRLALQRLDDRGWEQAIRAMAGKARFAAQLLAGEMPRRIEEAFMAARATLFPARAADLRTECSCPDSANPCKHIAAVHYVLGDAFDRDPFLLFELRGRSKDQVLGALRALREAKGGGRRRAVPEAPREPQGRRGVDLELAAPEAYDAFRASLDDLRFRIVEPPREGAALAHLGPPPSWSLPVDFAVLVQPAIGRAATVARMIALESDPVGEPENGATGNNDSPR